MQFDEKTIEKKMKELETRYLSPIFVNEKLLKHKSKTPKKPSPLKIVLTVFLNSICIFLILLASVMCFDTVASIAQGVGTSFLGYSNMMVVSGSMIWSGFNIGDIVVTRAVNPHTLRGGKYREGDMIAFYTYGDYYRDHFDLATSTRLTEEDYAPAVQYDYSIPLLLGFRNELMREASRSASNDAPKIVFHHIKDIYVDANGTYWFQTYGSSNADPIDVDHGDTLETHEQIPIGSEITIGVDSWYVHEDLIVGVYDTGFIARTMSGIISFISSSGGIILLLIPIFVVATFVIMQSVKDIQLAKLEICVVCERRKLTDEICVQSEIGYKMDYETKLKVLSQADKSEWELYKSLLWKDGELPREIKEYENTRSILLSATVKKLELNRICQKRFIQEQDHVPATVFYLTESVPIDDEQNVISNAIKNLHKDFTLGELQVQIERERFKESNKIAY